MALDVERIIVFGKHVLYHGAELVVDTLGFPR